MPMHADTKKVASGRATRSLSHRRASTLARPRCLASKGASSQPKPPVEPADRVLNSPHHEQAECGQFGHGEPLPAMLVAPLAGEAMHLADVVIRHVLHQLWRRRIIRHGANEADAKLSPTCEGWARGSGQRAISHSVIKGIIAPWSLVHPEQPGRLFSTWGPEPRKPISPLQIMLPNASSPALPC